MCIVNEDYDIAPSKALNPPALTLSSFLHRLYQKAGVRFRRPFNGGIQCFVNTGPVFVISAASVCAVGESADQQRHMKPLIHVCYSEDDLEEEEKS